MCGARRQARLCRGWLVLSWHRLSSFPTRWIWGGALDLPNSVLIIAYFHRLIIIMAALAGGRLYRPYSLYRRQALPVLPWMAMATSWLGGIVCSIQ